MDQSAKLKMPLVAAGQAQKHVTVNAALLCLDDILQLSVQCAPLNVPPVMPEDGGSWLVGPEPSGDFAGHATEVACRRDGGWVFHAPRDGWLAHDRESGRLRVHHAGAWPEVPTPAEIQGIDQLGIGTDADAANPLSVKANNALLTARSVGEGGDGDLRVKFNKATPADAGGLIFQTGYSGRAEIGLIGDDDLHIKVSANGSTWREAVRIDRNTGGVSMRFFDSHQVSVGYEAVVSLQPPSSGGIVIVSLVEAAYPQNAVSSILAYDVGASPLLTTMILGASAENLGTTTMTGTSGSAGKVAFAVDGSGNLYIQNRFAGGVARQICLTYINSYRAI